MEASQFLGDVRRYAYLLFLMIPLLSCTGCVSILRIDGPYKGKVVDAGTGQPIEGAVVNGTWYKIDPTPAGRSSTYYDSKEMLTDKNGEFKIAGQGLLVLSKIDWMDLIIFKAGYKELSSSMWEGLQESKGGGMVSWDGDRLTVKLRRMTLEERRHRFTPMPLGGPDNKSKLLRKESNKEMIELGYPANTLYPEE
jgi:hypothetical protein